MTSFVNCDATSEEEPVSTSGMVEKAAMTDDLISFNIYIRLLKRIYDWANIRILTLDSPWA